MKKVKREPTIRELLAQGDALDVSAAMCRAEAVRNHQAAQADDRREQSEDARRRNRYYAEAFPNSILAKPR